MRINRRSQAAVCRGAVSGFHVGGVGFVSVLQGKRLAMILSEFRQAYEAGRRDFSGEVLADVNFEGRDMEAVNFSGADLRGSRFRDCRLVEVRFDRADMRQADLAGAWIEGCRFEEAEMADSGLPEARVFDTDFRHAWLLGADLRGARVRDCSFVETDMRPSDRARTRADNALFENSDFEGSMVSEMSFAGVLLQGCAGEPALSDGADFTNCRAIPRPPEPGPGPEPDAGPTP